MLQVGELPIGLFKSKMGKVWVLQDSGTPFTSFRHVFEFLLSQNFVQRPKHFRVRALMSGPRGPKLATQRHATWRDVILLKHTIHRTRTFPHSTSIVIIRIRLTRSYQTIFQKSAIVLSFGPEINNASSRYYK